ncbi:MAG: hypothetical protein ACFFCM_22465 [Promethearchaeota archaeon]
MTIYVVLGILKDGYDPYNTPEVLKAFSTIEHAEEYCKKLINKADNPYKEIYWIATELEF